MREVIQHEPGTFCWPELATTNADSAKALYGALFDRTLTVRGRIQGSSSKPARLRTLSPPYHAQTGKSARTTAIQSASTRGAPARAGTSVPEAHHVPAILSLR